MSMVLTYDLEYQVTDEEYKEFLDDFETIHDEIPDADYIWESFEEFVMTRCKKTLEDTCNEAERATVVEDVRKKLTPPEIKTRTMEIISEINTKRQELRDLEKELKTLKDKFDLE